MEEVRQRVEYNASVKSSNLIILVLAILIACIGLNMNSITVLIGAMLISPLMGGIVAIGYGMAIYDIHLIRRSAMQLFCQALFSVLASVLYFTLTPISTGSPELLSGISPTIWDVLIALFGGIAGAIGNTRRVVTNVVPGVAIATALMPPLCTAGYGIVVGSFTFFIGALYLFFINSFFIAASSFIVFKLLSVPVVQNTQHVFFRHQKMVLYIAALIITIPSLYVAYNSIQENAKDVQVRAFISDKFTTFDMTNVISYKVSGQTLELDLVGKTLTEEEIMALQDSLQNYSKLHNVQLKIVQNLNDISLKEDLEKSIVNKLGNSLSGRDQKNYKELAEQYYPDHQRGSLDRKLIMSLQEQAPVLFPQIKQLQGGSLVETDKKGAASYQTFMVIAYVGTPLSTEDT